MAISSNQTTLTRRQVVSPAQRDYLRTQVRRIQAAGGSEADAVNFLRLEGHNPPQVTVTGGDPERDIGLIEGLSMSALQGITFGFGDEALGRIIGGFTRGQTGAEGVEAYREDLRRWAADHGKLNFLGELAGGLATGVAGMTRAGAVRVAPTLGRTIGLGAAGGAAAGAGYAEGGISERAKAAIFGGAFGGAFTGGLAGAGRIIGSVARPAARRGAEAVLPTSIAEAVEEGIPGLGSAEEHAREIVWRALVADGIETADDLVGRMDDIAATGVPATLADVGGPTLLRLAGEASASRSPAQQQFIEAVMERQAAQGDRTLGAAVQSLFRGTKLGTQNAYEAAETLATLQDDAAKPMYQRAHQEVVELSPRARAIMRQPEFQEAWSRGKLIGDREMFAGRAHQGALDIPSLPTNDLREQMVAKMRDLGVAEDRIMAQIAQIPEEFPAQVPVRGIDYLQRGLRKVIERGTREEGMEQKTADSLRAMLNEVLGEVDEKVPSFGAARLTYRGFESAQEAIDLGREMFAKKMHPSMVARRLGEMTPSDRAFARLGAIQHIADTIHNVRGKETRDFARDFFGARLFGGKSDQAERIRALFGDDAAAGEDFMRRLAAEARTSETIREGIKGVRGSIAKEAEEAAEGTIPSVRMTPELTFASMAREGLNKTKRAFLRRVYDEVSLLLAKGIDDPRELQIAAQAMEATHRRVSRGFGKVGQAVPLVVGAQTGELMAR